MERQSLIGTVAAVAFMLSACMMPPKYTVQRLGDKFSDPSKPYVVAGQNNRLSTKSSKGGIHIDGMGVYVDPFVYRDRETNQIRETGFFVNHYNYDLSDGFRPIEEIIFLADGKERVVLKVKSMGSDFDLGAWNPISKDFNSNYKERGLAIAPMEEFRKLAESTYLEVKIVGGHRQQTYDRNDVLPDFMTNLKSFYASEITTAPR